ncbi:YceI family protein [Parachryseolinea silvisoli]|jgi:polyisoprenoid-binding protein YceI|uniref:YceI family protein n=1 Tax=Parachryseolinea silvisoli TaxID=2873601 RepID=UPI00226599EB|nr:YceI family protein [Parachryseolinea silvisoli]MCD9014882.1 YceI family protein [Parachryseolinea silvisoli]
MKNEIFKIVPEQSKIEWIGKKVTGAHDGTIDVKEGEIVLNGGKVVGGTVVVNTASIKILDILDPATNTQMLTHLASDDFFSIEEFPEAVLNIISVNGDRVEADLTIKGIKHPVSFGISANASNTLLTASARVIVDRTKYEMKFRSGNFFQNLGDTLIYNDFELNVTLTAKAVKKDVSVTV